MFVVDERLCVVVVGVVDSSFFFVKKYFLSLYICMY